MIKGFEEYTRELNDDENASIDLVAEIIEESVGKDMSITNKEICELVTQHRCDVEISSPRMRKIIHIIRVTGKVENVLATSKGYYVAETQKEWLDYLDGLASRLDSIMDVQSAIIKQGIVKKW